MRHLVGLLLFATACGSAGPAPASTPRPSPESGGFRAAEPPKTHSWKLLGMPVETAPSQQTIEVGGAGGKIGAIMIKGVSGEAEIEQITVEYLNEQSRRVDLKKRFLPGDVQVIELREEHAISKIVVFLDPDTQGTVEIFGT